MTDFTLKEVTVFRAATILNEALHQMQFPRNLQNIQHNLQYKSRLPNVISIRNKKFRLFKFRHQ